MIKRFFVFSFCCCVLFGSKFSVAQNQFSNFYPGYHFHMVIPTSDTGFAAVMVSQQNSNVIVKFDSIGNVQWAKKVQYNGIDFALKNIAELNTREFMVSGTDGLHPSLIKVDSSGILIFAKTGLGEIENFFQTLDSNFMISSAGWNLYKIDLNANLIWCKHPYPYPNSSPGYSSFAFQTDSGNIIYAGSYNVWPMDATNFLFIQKIDSSGNLLWSKCNSIYSNNPYPLRICEYEGEYYINFIADTNFISYEVIYKVSSVNGEPVWIRKYDGGDIYQFNPGLFKSSDGKLIIFRNDSYASVIDSSAAIQYSVKYDSLFDFQNCFELKNQHLCIPGAISDGAVLGKTDSSLHLSCFTSSLNAPPLTQLQDTLVNSGSLFATTAFAADITASFTLTSVSLSTLDYCNWVGTATDFERDEFSVFPNPSGNLLALRFSDRIHDDISISIYNSIGELMLQQKNPGVSNGVITISTKNFPSGFYFVKVEGDNLNASARICVMHD